MTKRKIGSVAFVITGEFLTDHYREMALEGNWRHALRELQDNLDGMTDDQAYRVLNGSKKLIGDSNEGIDYVDDDALEDVREAYTEQYTDIWLPTGDGSMWKVKSCENDWSKANVWLLANSERSLSHSTVKGFTPTAHELARYYGIGEGFKYTIEKSGKHTYFVVWEPANVDVAPWVDLERHSSTVFENTGTVGVLYPPLMHEYEVEQFREQFRQEPTKEELAERARREEQRAALAKAEEEARIRKQQEEYDALRERILEQNGDDFVELKGFKVPRKPLVAWALSRTSHSRLVDNQWTPITQSGYKMMNDNPYHTDWVIGSGADIDDFYNKHEDLNDAAFEWGYKLKRKLTTGYLEVLVECRKSSLEGNVSRPSHDGKVTTDIVFIPDCSTKWINVAKQVGKRGGIIVTNKGGALSHLVMNGEEYGVTLMYAPDADRVFEDGVRTTIYPDSGNYYLQD